MARLNTKGMSPGIIQRQYVPASCASLGNVHQRRQLIRPWTPDGKSTSSRMVRRQVYLCDNVRLPEEMHRHRFCVPEADPHDHRNAAHDR